MDDRMRRRCAWRLIAALGTFGAGALLAAPASAAVRCTYLAESDTVRIVILGDNLDGSVSKLELCGPPEARRVLITPGHGIGSDSLEIDTAERFAGRNIHWRILGGSLFVVGDGRDPVHYTVGADGLNFGAGEGLDLVFDTPVGNIFLSANGAGGVLSGQGGAGTGAPSTEFLVMAAGRNVPEPYPFFTTKGAGATILGGDESDELLGAAGDDTIQGFGGNDSITGAKGDDLVDGGDANDFVKGGAGDDTLIGGAGTDILLGGTGDDTLLADDAEADTLDGGAGLDGALADPLDTIRRVEAFLP
jgi:Ca2+-binding RTX toxin-like protein